MNKSKITWLAYILLLISIVVFAIFTEDPYDYENLIGVITIIYFIFGVIAYMFKYDVGPKIIWKVSTIMAISWNVQTFIIDLITSSEQYHWVGVIILVLSFILILGPAVYATLRYSYSK